MEDIVVKVLLVVIPLVLGAIGSILILQFRQISMDLKDMSKSVQELNKQLIKVISDQEWHMREIENLKTKIGYK